MARKMYSFGERGEQISEKPEVGKYRKGTYGYEKVTALGPGDQVYGQLWSPYDEDVPAAAPGEAPAAAGPTAQAAAAERAPSTGWADMNAPGALGGRLGNRVPPMSRYALIQAAQQRGGRIF